MPKAGLYLLVSLLGGIAGLLADEGQVSIQGVETLTRERQRAGRFIEELRAGWSHFQGSRWDVAETVFQSVLESGDATPVDRIQAIYGIGLCHKFHQPVARPDAARESFLRIVEEFPENSVVPWALLELGILARTKSADLDYQGNGHENDEARGYFQRILQDYPHSLAIHEAALRLASSWFFEVQPEVSRRGAEILEEHLRQFPDNPLASTMRYRLGFWYVVVAQDYPVGVPHLVKQGELKLADPFRWGQNYWGIAQFLRFGLKKPKESVLWYEKITTEAPGTAMVLSARKELALLRPVMNSVPEDAHADPAKGMEETGSKPTAQTPNRFNDGNDG